MLHTVCLVDLFRLIELTTAFKPVTITFKINELPQRRQHAVTASRIKIEGPLRVFGGDVLLQTLQQTSAIIMRLHIS